MSFITLIIVISILVFVHEFGHFIAAKKTGVRVDEFAIGFPPKIFSWKRGETKYALNLIPFGGYVKIFGENPDEEEDNGSDKKRNFQNKSPLVQAVILVAGVVFNIIFAWLLLSASYTIGMDRLSTEKNSVMVTQISENSPASIAGFKVGDMIKEVTYGKKTFNEITSTIISDAVNNSKGAPMTVKVIRKEEIVPLTVSATTTLINGKYAIGIQMASIENIKLPIHLALLEGAKTTWTMMKETTVGLGKFFAGIFSFSADLSQVSGPVGIAGFLEQARQYGVSQLFIFVALISINLAVINLLPFPALDGGRLLFVIIEAISRKKISSKVANTTNAIGFIVLILLMIVVTVTDIGKLIN